MVWRELDARRVRLADGTRSGTALAVLGFGALAVAALLVIVWSGLPGAEYISPLPAAPTIPALAVDGALLAAAAAMTLIGAWSAGAADLRRVVAIIGCAAVGAVSGIVLLSVAARERSAASDAPSLVGIGSAGRVFTIAALAVFASCTVALVASRLAGPAARLATAVGAGLPPICVIGALMAADGMTQLEVTATLAASDGTLAETQVRTVGSPVSVVVLLLLIVSGIAVIAVFYAAATGIREVIVERHRSAQRMTRRATASWRLVTIIAAAVMLLLFLVGRTGRLGGVDALPAFGKESLESWILAVAFACAGLAALRSSEQRPWRRRGVLGVITGAAVLLALGSIVTAIANVVAVLDESFFGAGWVHVLAQEWLPSWALWAQDWSNLVLPVGSGVLGLALVVRGERSDRSALLLALAAISALPGLLIILAEHDIDAGLAEFSPATPDQVMLVAVAIVAVGAAVGRSIISPARSLRMVVAIGLILFVTTVFGASISARFFEFAIVVPVLIAVLFNGAHLRQHPDRSAFAVAGGVVLLLLTVSGLMMGTLGPDRSQPELLAFLVLSGPLILVELARTVRVQLPAERPRWRTAMRFAPLVVTVPVLVLLVGAAVAVGRSNPSGGSAAFPLLAEVHDGWDGVQVRRDDGSQLRLERGLTVVYAVHSPITPVACTEEGLAGVGNLVVVPGSLQEAPATAGLPSVVGQLADGGRVLCAAEVDASSAAVVLAVFDGDVSPDLRAQLDDISFPGR